jgi:hypothetical protein
MNPPYTYEELAELKHQLSSKIKSYERETQSRPLPPMEEEEALVLLTCFIDTATERLLTGDEAGMMGQLLATHKMAVEARMLGKKGRYFVVSQADVERLAKKEE